MSRFGAIVSSAEGLAMTTQTPTPGATVSLTAPTSIQVVCARWTAGEAETVNLSGTPTAGSLLILQITNDATLPRVITLGTGFVSTGVITGVASKVSTVLCVSNGTSMYECARSVGL